MTLATFVRLTIGIGMWVGCAQPPSQAPSFEFHLGFHGMPWGAQRPQLDSLIRQDSGLTLQSDLASETNGSVTAVRDSSGSYYLEWSPAGRLIGLSTIREDSPDSLIARLSRTYGTPRRSLQSRWDRRSWDIHGRHIDLLITQRYYSLKIQVEE